MICVQVYMLRRRILHLNLRLATVAFACPGRLNSMTFGVKRHAFLFHYDAALLVKLHQPHDG